MDSLKSGGNISEIDKMILPYEIQNKLVPIERDGKTTAGRISLMRYVMEPVVSGLSVS